LNASRIGFGDETGAESGLPARFDPGFAGQRIALSVSFAGAKEPCGPFSAITTPAETNFWLNH
jgi:hypothetical protein